MSYEPYTEKDFSLPEMEGFSQKQIEAHLKLYSGYIKNINGLAHDMRAFAHHGTNERVLSELQRRFAFEWDGMRMHEYYFEGLGGNGDHKHAPTLTEDLKKKFGSFESWSKEFRAIGLMRGVGWVVLCHDTRNDLLFNVWVSDHEIGHLAGTKVIHALDVWEHAFLLDYLPSERGKYIDAFNANVKWEELEKRYSHN